ncbi:hypothetical protein BDY21DRAFT_281061, partial [Lineolata rhizophorae]
MPLDTVTTTFFISNLHCPSCVAGIEAALKALHPPPRSISHSILTHQIVARHSSELPVQAIREALDLAGFEIHSVFEEGEAQQDDRPKPTGIRHFGTEWESSLERAVARW